MKTPCPCEEKTAFTAASRPPLKKRMAGALRWLIPGTLLALMPKCPVCLAAYIALISGVGLSLPVATFLRTGLIVVCVLSLAFLTIRQIRRLISRPHVGT